MLDTLSVRTVERLAPADDAYEVRDRKTRGFLIRVQPTGVKTSFCEYRRGQRVRIGRVDLITPTEARAQAVNHKCRAVDVLCESAPDRPSLQKAKR